MNNLKTGQPSLRSRARYFRPGLLTRCMPRSEYAGLLTPRGLELAAEFTPRGLELAAEYDAVRDNPELDCKSGMPNTMLDPPPMRIINGLERIIIRQEAYDIERIIYMGE